MSAIYAKLGATPEKIPILWLAPGPVTGSAHPAGHRGHEQATRVGPLGRRRPYFLAGAIPRQVSGYFPCPTPHQIWATGRDVVDSGRVHQCEHGTVSRLFMARQVVAQPAHLGILDCKAFSSALARRSPTRCRTSLAKKNGVTGDAPNGVRHGRSALFLANSVRVGRTGWRSLWTVFTSE